MPNKRGRNLKSGQYVQSDYDTDNLTDMAAAVAPPPPIPPRTNEELNLTVLQRHDPSVHQILSVAPFAVVYLFSATTQQWEKCGIEGTLFVCSLLPQEDGLQTERYCVTVLNRRGLDNFATELFSANDVDITDEYVILQVVGDDGATLIYGLWIFSEPEPSSTAQTRVVNALIIQECAMRAENSRGEIDEAVAHVEETYIEESQPPPSPPPQQQQPQQQQYEPIQAHFQHMSAPEPAPPQQVNLLDLFASKPTQPGPVPSLASPFPSQSQNHHYFPQQGHFSVQQQQQQHQHQNQQQHYQPQLQPQPQAQYPHPQPQQQNNFPPAVQHFPPGFGTPPQGQPDVLASLFSKARQDYHG